LTGLSIAAMATNMRVGGGGAYYLISRTLGLVGSPGIGTPTRGSPGRVAATSRPGGRSCPAARSDGCGISVVSLNSNYYATSAPRLHGAAALTRLRPRGAPAARTRSPGTRSSGSGMG
jgi:hypothetical protein